jgi:hypothetical protein
MEALAANAAMQASREAHELILGALTIRLRGRHADKVRPGMYVTVHTAWTTIV